MGRSFHLIASCSKDAIFVWKVVVRDIFNCDSETKGGIYKEPIID